jgi:polyphenol oxidase
VETRGYPAVVTVVERRGALEVDRLVGLDKLGADVVVTTRRGGVSAAPYDTLNLGDHVGDDDAAVAENRRRLASAMGVGTERLVIVRQVHGADVVRVDGDDSPDAPPAADAIVTTDPSVAICVLVADCVPVVLLDPIAHVLAVVHAGWRGTAARAVGHAVEAMRAAGAVPDRCHAAMGPCISAHGYQVGDEVATALREAGCATAIGPDGTGRYLADLAMATRTLLVGAGLAEDRIAGPMAATDGGVRYFSDRAARPCGRFALVARLQGSGS